jgi:uncharacterized protein YndB with AHSA1/START domain
MRYVLIVVGALVGIAAVIVIIGWSLPVGHQATVEKSFRATPSQLFALINDVAAFPTWRSEVTRAEVLPDENGHRRWLEATKHGAPLTFLVEKSVPERLLVSRIANTGLPFGGSWTYELEPKDAGVTALRVTEDGEVYNPIFRFVSRFVMGHETTIRQYLAAVGKRYPEVESSVVEARGAQQR